MTERKRRLFRATVLGVGVAAVAGMLLFMSGPTLRGLLRNGLQPVDLVVVPATAWWSAPLLLYSSRVKTTVGTLVLGPALLASTVVLLALVFADEHSTAGLGLVFVPLYQLVVVGLLTVLDGRAQRGGPVDPRPIAIGVVFGVGWGLISGFLVASDPSLKFGLWTGLLTGVFASLAVWLLLRWAGEHPGQAQLRPARVAAFVSIVLLTWGVLPYLLGAWSLGRSAAVAGSMVLLGGVVVLLLRHALRPRFKATGGRRR